MQKWGARPPLWKTWGGPSPPDPGFDAYVLSAYRLQNDRQPCIKRLTQPPFSSHRNVIFNNVVINFYDIGHIPHIAHRRSLDRSDDCTVGHINSQVTQESCILNETHGINRFRACVTLIIDLFTELFLSTAIHRRHGQRISHFGELYSPRRPKIGQTGA